MIFGLLEKMSFSGPDPLAMRPGAPGVEDFGLWLTLEQLTVPVPLAEVFVTSDLSNTWSVIGVTYGRSQKYD